MAPVRCPSFAIRTGVFRACSVLLKFRLQKFDIFRHCKSYPVFCALSAIRTGVFSEEFLLTPLLYLCFAIHTRVFLYDVELGILILVTNMALRIQNDVIIRKTIKKQNCQYFGNAKMSRTLDKRSASGNLQNQFLMTTLRVKIWHILHILPGKR